MKTSIDFTTYSLIKPEIFNKYKLIQTCYCENSLWTVILITCFLKPVVYNDILHLSTDDTIKHFFENIGFNVISDEYSYNHLNHSLSKIIALKINPKQSTDEFKQLFDDNGFPFLKKAYNFFEKFYFNDDYE